MVTFQPSITPIGCGSGGAFTVAARTLRFHSGWTAAR